MLVCLALRLVAAVVGVGEFIVLRLADAAGGDPQAGEHAEVLAREIPAHMVIE